MYSSDSIGTLGLADQIHAIICEMAIDIHVSILLIPSLQAPHCWYGFEYVKVSMLIKNNIAAKLI